MKIITKIFTCFLIVFIIAIVISGMISHTHKASLYLSNAVLLNKIGECLEIYLQNHNDTYPTNINIFRKEFSESEQIFFDDVHYFEFLRNSGNDTNGWLIKVIAYIEIGKKYCFLYNHNLKVNYNGQTKIEYYNSIFKITLQDAAGKPLDAVRQKKARGYTDLLYAIYTQNLESATNEINNINDINIPDPNGLTPLMYAVIKNNRGLITLLLSKGANIEITNFLGDTAFDIAKLYHNSDALSIARPLEK